MLTKQFLANPPIFSEGALELPAGPGFGVDILQEALDARPYTPCSGGR